MKRWLTHLTIVAYLGVLSWGVAAHAVSYKVGVHTSMYFIVWDMFCGWASHASRLQIIGQGESGKYYELGPGPWGQFKPFGDIGRRHYDAFGVHIPRMAINCLKHTKHEPMVRVYVVEECWPKKYNLPDRVWRQRHNEPKEVQHYYHVRHIMTGDGQLLQVNGHWAAYQNALCVSDNPRLQADRRRGQPVMTATPRQHSAN